MSKYYVVVQRGEEYDDEYYSLNERGSPERVFTNRKAAQEWANERNAAKMSGISLSDYYEGQNDFKGLRETIQEMFPHHKWDEDFQNLPELTTEQYTLIRKELPFEFYSVQEVDGEDS